jgi:hypothetical protein
MHENVYPAAKFLPEANKITLVLTPLRFFTKDDEEIFFLWLKKIKCIEKIQGIKKELYITISSSTIEDNDLENLQGLFERYKIKNPSQLQVFEHSNDA